VTNEQFPINEAGAKTVVVSLGNGDFAVSDTDEGGKPALLVVDPTNSSNIIVSAAQVPSGLHGITVSGDTLYATTSSGLSIYQIGQLVSDPVTITATLPPDTAVSIPASSFNIPPTQIITGKTADTLTWDRSFSAGDTTFNFTWQTGVSGVQAGEATPVTQGATSSFVQGTPGTLNPPGTSVTGEAALAVIVGPHRLFRRSPGCLRKASSDGVREIAHRARRARPVSEERVRRSHTPFGWRT
jgi:hypothetical protein